jgi:lytic murein transglycosylase
MQSSSLSTPRLLWQVIGVKRTIRLALAATLSTALFASAAPAQDAAPKPDFESWLSTYRAAALARGISPATLDTMLAGLTANDRVVRLDRNQPDESSTAAAPPRFSSYLKRRLTPARISAGETAAANIQPALAGIEARYGVPGPILLGIWGMETSYGRITGNMNVTRSLATLAWDGRREKLFTRELDAALDIVDRGLAAPEKLRGSWAGAMGQPQFLPSSYLAYARDGDGDGKADIWDSSPDALASMANYLVENGWQRGLDWGVAVDVPEDFDRGLVKNPVPPTSCIRPLERHSLPQPAATWQAYGITSQKPLPDAPLVLIEPDGPGQGAWLVTTNYRVLMTYNCSNFYALSVAMLGDELSR